MLMLAGTTLVANGAKNITSFLRLAKGQQIYLRRNQYRCMLVKAAVENDLVFNVAKNITFLCLVTSQHIDLQNQRQSPSIKWVWFFLCISIILVLIG